MRLQANVSCTRLFSYFCFSVYPFHPCSGFALHADVSLVPRMADWLRSTTQNYNNWIKPINNIFIVKFSTKLNRDDIVRRYECACDHLLLLCPFLNSHKIMNKMECYWVGRAVSMWFSLCIIVLCSVSVLTFLCAFIANNIRVFFLKKEWEE